MEYSQKGKSKAGVSLTSDTKKIIISATRWELIHFFMALEEDHA
jgi:hypothetical protein